MTPCAYSWYKHTPDTSVKYPFPDFFWAQIAKDPQQYPPPFSYEICIVVEHHIEAVKEKK